MPAPGSNPSTAKSWIPVAVLLGTLAVTAAATHHVAVASASQEHEPLAVFVVIGGVCIGLLLFLVTRAQVRARAAAEKTAADVKHAEEAVRRSQEQLRLVIDALPLLISYIDRDHRFRFNNRAYTDWFGVDPEQLVGKPVREFLGEEAYARAAARIERAFAGENVNYERVQRLRDGRDHVINVNLIPHTGPSGQVEGVITLITDITERKAVEEERSRLLAGEREARADAETANRIKDEFLATLSHELRTPLNAILGWAQLLRMNGTPREDFEHGLETIERNAKVQAQLVEDLLDLSRIISGKLRLEMKPLDLPAVMDAALDSVRPAATAKSIRLIPVLDAHAGPVLGDAGRLQQVVWNLLSNAIKFTPEGGRVDLLLQRADGHAEIVVSDTGQGIDPEFLPHVFDRLRQADSSTTRRHGGLGLGLAIVRHLVESHGGTVRAESRGEGKGATFTASLPILTPAASASPRAPVVSGSAQRADGGAALSGVRVLVVDDDPDALDLVSRVLKQSGADVRTAGSAAEALRAMSAYRPHVLLSDIAMPGEDGYDLIRQVRSAQGQTPPAVALTAFARREDRLRALQAGFQSHVSKPVEPAELVAVVATLAKGTD
jgi:PAS domain S-box-containing protein